MEFWRFRECVMHSTAACATCTACTVKHHNGLQAFRNVSAMHRNAVQRTVVICLSVGLHWHPGKTAEWIMHDAVGDGGWVGLWRMHVLDFGGDHRRGRGNFAGEFGALHGCQWEVCWMVVWKWM